MKRWNPMIWAMAALLALVMTPTALAIGGPDLGEGQLAELDHGRSEVFWRVFAEHERVTLTVSTPCGVIERSYDGGEDPYFSLDELKPDDPRGSYTWQIRIDPKVDPGVRKELDRARLEGDDETVRALRRKGLLPQGPFIQTGSFSVDEGGILDLSEEEGKQGISGKTSAGDKGLGLVTGESINFITEEAQIISPDGVVYNSLCVGFDCPTSPSFGSDTIRLQENNLRIHADDTSTAGGFPNQDWRLEFNSNLNGGAEYFRVIDATASRNIMTLEANAPSNALVVDNGGRVGMGTANPVVELHVASGDTPAMRLDQTTGSGFAAQVWDVAGNETSFFVRDATNGSTLPFRIRPGASSNTLVIDTESQVGIGVLSPSRKLEIVDTGAPDNTVLELKNNGGTRMRINNTSTGEVWNIGHQLPSQTGLTFSDVGDADSELLLDVNGNLTITGDLVTGGGGACDPGPCDGTFSPDYAITPIEEHAEYMWQNRHLWGVGPTPEGKPLNMTKKVTGILHELEVAHIYIEQLHDGLQAKDQRIASLEDRLAAIEARLAETAQGSVD